MGATEALMTMISIQLFAFFHPESNLGLTRACILDFYFDNMFFNIVFTVNGFPVSYGFIMIWYPFSAGLYYNLSNLYYGFMGA